MPSTRTFRTHIDLAPDIRMTMIELINAQLADTFDLYSHLKQAHWNVKGMDFFQLHALFDTLAETMLEHVDLIAERATALGGAAMGTVRMAAVASRLAEYPVEATEGQEHVAALVERFGAYAASTRAAIDVADDKGDLDTADMFTEVSRAVDKHLWFLEAHLQA